MLGGTADTNTSSYYLSILIFGQKRPDIRVRLVHFEYLQEDSEQRAKETNMVLIYGPLETFSRSHMRVCARSLDSWIRCRNRDNRHEPDKLDFESLEFFEQKGPNMGLHLFSFEPS